jgi:PhnB protein
MSVPPIPEGYHSLTPYLHVKDAARAIEFYKKAFGAEELFRMEGPGGRVAHAEIKIGDSPLMLSDEAPEMNALSPETLGGTPVSLLIYTEDVDALAARAVAAGLTVRREVMDQFYGHRSGTFVDPFGHIWTLSTQKEILTPEEMDERLKAAMSQHKPG